MRLYYAVSALLVGLLMVGCGSDDRDAASIDSSTAAPVVVEDQERLLRLPTADEVAVALATLPEGTSEFASTWPNGNRQAIGYTLDGQPIGEWIYFHPSGRLAMRGTYRAGGTQEGEWGMWHTNGARKAIGSWHRGEEHGPWTWYHTNGQPAMEGLFVQGQRHGEWRTFFEDGSVSAEGFYAGPGQVGRWVYVDRDTGRFSDVQYQQPGGDWPDGIRAR